MGTKNRKKMKEKQRIDEEIYDEFVSLSFFNAKRNVKSTGWGKLDTELMKESWNQNKQK